MNLDNLHVLLVCADDMINGINYGSGARDRLREAVRNTRENLKQVDVKIEIEDRT